jgi:hypothetical protein
MKNILWSPWLQSFLPAPIYHLILPQFLIEFPCNKTFKYITLSTLVFVEGTFFLLIYIHGNIKCVLLIKWWWDVFLSPIFLKKKKLSYSATSQVPRLRWSPKYKDRGCQDFLTPQEALRDVYGAIVEYWLTRETSRISEINLLPCHFVHQESYTKLPWIKPAMRSQQAVIKSRSETTYFVRSTARVNY